MTLVRGSPAAPVPGGFVSRLRGWRRQRVLRDFERRSRWAEQARRTPTVRQLVEATSVAIPVSAERRTRPVD